MTEFYLEHDEQGHPVTAGEPLSVGSGSACGLPVQADGVEEEHVVVRQEGDRVVLQSRVPGEHDARVNGVAVHAGTLKPGDKIEFGDVEATFEMDGDDPKLLVGEDSHALVKGVNAIGRDPGSGVAIDHESVSRKHAAIMILPSGQMIIRDLGSANGTTVRGRRLGEVELKAGDEIRLGDAVLHLRQKPGAQKTPASPPGPPSGAPLAATVVGSRPGPSETSAAPPSAPKLELEFRGKKTQLEEGTARIGRATDCNIVIDDDALVSRHHAEVEVSGSLVMLRDLGSSNGTRLNGEAISRATPIKDGDRIGIGGQEIKFSAEIPVTPFGQTMVARELPGAAGRTAVAPKGREPAGAVVTPTDRPSALQVLDLGPEARDEQIQQRYRELYSEFQVRLTNAPTAQLKGTYERRLNDLKKALQILSPKAATGAPGDLPALKPGEDDADAPPPPAAGESTAAAGASEPRAPDAESGDAPPAAAASKPSGGARRLPRSTIVVGGVCALLLAGVIVGALGAMRAGSVTAGLRADLESRTAELQEMESAIPETQQEFEKLAEGKGQLVAQNLELKICNHSSAPLTWVWLNVAWFDAEAAGFRRFDTAYDTQWEYLYYDESIPPGGTFSGGGWVVGEQRVWDGSAVFFAARLEYRGEEILRAGAMPAFGGDCYPLNLDR